MPTTTTLYRLIRNLISDLASTVSGRGASLVGVEDSYEYYDSTTVETALREVGPVLEYMNDDADGLHAKRVMRVTFDPSANAGERTVGAHYSADGLLINTVVTRAWYQVITTFTSAADTATISIGISNDDVAGIMAAIPINDGGNPWDAGFHDAIQDGAAANFANKVTASGTTIHFTVGGQALTAGKLILFLEYVQA